jgi:hypothetical protein
MGTPAKWPMLFLRKREERLRKLRDFEKRRKSSIKGIVLTLLRELLQKMRELIVPVPGG